MGLKKRQSFSLIETRGSSTQREDRRTGYVCIIRQGQTQSRLAMPFHIGLSLLYFRFPPSSRYPNITHPRSRVPFPTPLSFPSILRCFSSVPANNNPSIIHCYLCVYAVKRIRRERKRILRSEDATATYSFRVLNQSRTTLTPCSRYLFH